MSKESKGIPVYHEEVVRKIVSTGDEETESIKTWYPSSPVSKRLWACLEVLRDINDLLEDGVTAKNSGKRKRRAKVIAGHTHSLAKSLNDLCKTVIGDRDLRKQIDKKNVKQVQKIQKDFSDFVPFEWGCELSTYRNKLVAHFDKDFWPRDADELLNTIPTHKIGYWLHACLHVALDLTKLDIYSWTCDSGHEGYVRFMSNEPYLVTFKIDAETNDLTEFVGLSVASNVPRNTVRDVVGETIEYSQWLFKKGQPRIKSLKEDSRKNWNTFSENLDFYKANGSI